MEMREKLGALGFLLILVDLSYQGTEQDRSNYYTAAVVEFSPIYKGNAAVTLKENTDAYVKYIEKAKQQNADIIVFPEDGLTSLNMPERSRMDAWTTVVPPVLDEYTPCTGNAVNVSETLKTLSCAALQNRIYVVINIAEKEICEPNDDQCSDGIRYHNTNVAFDRTGKIIARYRKVNLYMEWRFDRTKSPEIVTFDTDFGVRFGTFTCFDILFPVPALNLTRIEGISDIVFPTAWFSEIPFLTAVQTQFGWSFAEDVNLLVAGYHQPDIGNAGSGIYLGRNGIANVTMTRNPENRLLISRVPKRTRSEKNGKAECSTIVDKKEEGKVEMSFSGEQCAVSPTVTDGIANAFYDSERKGDGTDWIRLLHDNLTTFESLPVNFSMDKSICQQNFCCHFHARTPLVSNPSSIVYHAVVYNGVRLYGTEVEAGVRLCAVIQCANDSILSCNSISQSNITFTALSVTATFDDDYSNMLAMPSMLEPSLLPTGHWTYAKRADGKQTNLTVALNESTNDLVTFGIYTRDFARDKWNRN
ncbi:vanin-like protein 1 [Xylocopa sonorina]|uniref:vanin-like protein 1 n=1 Tax=Xylocopa sonorina TaxID=1818115 RepID=UPI00403AF877